MFSVALSFLFEKKVGKETFVRGEFTPLSANSFLRFPLMKVFIQDSLYPEN